jgi:hypothetical protein
MFLQDGDYRYRKVPLGHQLQKLDAAGESEHKTTKRRQAAVSAVAEPIIIKGKRRKQHMPDALKGCIKSTFLCTECKVTHLCVFVAFPSY